MATLWLMQAGPYPGLHKGAQDRKPDLGLLGGEEVQLGGPATLLSACPGFPGGVYSLQEVEEP